MPLPRWLQGVGEGVGLGSSEASEDATQGGIFAGASPSFGRGGRGDDGAPVQAREQAGPARNTRAPRWGRRPITHPSKTSDS
jgi:hypothetical protein